MDMSIVHSMHSKFAVAGPCSSRSMFAVQRHVAHTEAAPESEWVGPLEGGGALRCMRASSPAFRDVLMLRSMVYGRPASACRERFDDAADHYVSYRGAVPVYALRVSHASRGTFECERQYPPHLVERFRTRLVSSGRLVRNPVVPGSAERLRHFLAGCWADICSWGARIEVTNVLAQMLPFYQTLGYFALPMPPFQHPLWEREGFAVCFLANPALPGAINGGLDDLDDVIAMSEIERVY
ncbi:hypothetical protein [Haliangium ochraceum]|nr:hypothetical protein [Haliangium ochraceum]